MGVILCHVHWATLFFLRLQCMRFTPVPSFIQPASQEWQRAYLKRWWHPPFSTLLWGLVRTFVLDRFWDGSSAMAISIENTYCQIKRQDVFPVVHELCSLPPPITLRFCALCSKAQPSLAHPSSQAPSGPLTSTFQPPLSCASEETRN